MAATIPFNIIVVPDGATGTFSLAPVSAGLPVSGSIPIPQLIQLTPGNYTLTINATGYQTYTEVVAAADTGTTVQLTANSDNGVGLPSNPTPVNTGSTAIVTNNKPPSPEFQAPNADYGKYFMSTDARVYIGDTFVDEVDWVQYVVQANQVPVYPYRSKFFAAMGTGRTLVQGQIGINFISEGYLYAVLENFANSPNVGSSDAVLQSELNDLVVAQQKLNVSQPPSGASSVSGADIVAYNQSQALAYQARITALVKAMGANGSSALATAQKYAKEFFGKDTDYTNPVYLPIPFDMVLNFSGGGRTVTRKLTNCFLISNEQQVSRDGKIIMDTYGFVAQKIR